MTDAEGVPQYVMAQVFEVTSNPSGDPHNCILDTLGQRHFKFLTVPRRGELVRLPRMGPKITYFVETVLHDGSEQDFRVPWMAPNVTLFVSRMWQDPE